MSNCEAYCLEKFDTSEAQGASCRAAYGDAMTCLSDLTCDEYESWLRDEPGSPCASARADVQDACDGIFLEPHVLPP